MKKFKEKTIEGLVSLLRKEEVDVGSIDIENETEQLSNGFMVEETLTGCSTITIKLINKETHSKFIEKLQGMK